MKPEINELEYNSLSPEEKGKYSYSHHQRSLGVFYRLIPEEPEATVKESQPKIWEIVKAIEEDKENWAQRYAEAKATMVINFGPDAKIYPGIITGNEPLHLMITEALTYLHNRVSNANLIPRQEVIDILEAEERNYVILGNPTEVQVVSCIISKIKSL
jgi:hypothetical protein